MNESIPELGFSAAVPIIEPLPKPRQVGMTEIRDAAMGMNQIEDLVNTLGVYIDSVKSTCGTQRLISRDYTREKNRYLREHGIDVSTGGLLERVVMEGPRAVTAFLDECQELGFTIVEISSGLISMPLESKVALVRAVKDAGLKPKPEVATTYGLADQSVPGDADFLLREIEACVEAGADIVMLEEEGIFEYVDEFDTALVHRLVRAVGTEKIMFEASERKTIYWLLANYGTDVNIFCDPRSLAYLCSYRANLWGNSTIWARMAAYRP